MNPVVVGSACDDGPTEMESTTTEPITTDDPAAGHAPAIPADLSMVVLIVGDMPALRGYYRSLGWQEQPGASDALAIFQLGGVALALHPDRGSETAATAAARRDRSAVTLVVRLATRDEVTRAFSSAVGAGGQAVSEPEDHGWGGRSGLVADPEGNRWELLWVDRSGPPTEGASGTAG